MYFAIKDIYKLVLNSEYKSATLDSLYRHINSLQFQTFNFKLYYFLIRLLNLIKK